MIMQLLYINQILLVIFYGNASYINNSALYVYKCMSKRFTSVYFFKQFSIVEEISLVGLKTCSFMGKMIRELAIAIVIVLNFLTFGAY